MNSYIDMYDLPTESELAEIMTEASKKNAKVGEIDTKTVFPFWSSNSKSNVVSDKTGAVKPKADLKRRGGDVQSDWEDFLKNMKTVGNKPATKSAEFGTVVVKSYAEDPDPKKVVGSVKALKTTKVTELSGKSTTKTEELGTGKVVTKSNAASPKKDNLVGVVKPKAELGKQSVPSIIGTSKKPFQAMPSDSKVYNSYSDTIKPMNLDHISGYTVKDKIPGSKIPTNGKTVVSDKSGAVKPKTALGTQNVPKIAK